MSDQQPPYPGRGDVPPPPPPPPGYGPPQYPQAGYGQPVHGQPGYGPPQYGAYGMQPPPSAYASWLQRVGAYLVDALCLVPFYIVAAIGLGIAGAGGATSTDAYGNVTADFGPGAAIGFLIAALGYLGIFVFILWNQIFRQGRTGWSIGKQVLSIRLVDEQTGQPIGAGMNFVRQICHVLDALACYLGYLWPLWDAKRQTFADKIMHTVVIPQAKPKA